MLQMIDDLLDFFLRQDVCESERMGGRKDEEGRTRREKEGGRGTRITRTQRINRNQR